MELETARENVPKKKSLSLKKPGHGQNIYGQKKLAFTQKSGDTTSSSASLPPASVTGGAGEEKRETATHGPSSVWLSGLCNLGNTCYANSILQVLRFCPHFGPNVTILSNQLLQQQQQEDDEVEVIDSESSGSEGWKLKKKALAIHLCKVKGWHNNNYVFREG